jgi:hypothetical protein
MKLVTATMVASTLLIACESGPEVLFEPNDGDPNQQNGFKPGVPYTNENPTKGYGDESSGDAVGRARFCDEAEATAQIQELVKKPIIPDDSVGGIKLLGDDGKPVHADSLLGRPADGKLCDPTVEYLDAFSFGPTEEIIILFDQETRLVSGILAYKQYLGSLEGDFTKDGQQVHVVIKPRERVLLGDRELDEYTSRADQATRPDAFLNYANITAMYKMIRETFFGAEAFAEDYDCVAENVCNIIYTAGNESQPQVTGIIIQDSGVVIVFEPDGSIQYIEIDPVRIAPFEVEASISFGTTGSSTMAFRFESTLRPNCDISLNDDISYAAFKQRCVNTGDERALARAGYDVHTSRDAVQQGFNGVDLGWLRKTSTEDVFKDGEAPKDTDKLFSFAYNFNLTAPTEEFRALTLATGYKARIENRIRNAIVATNPNVPPGTHPFESFEVEIPLMGDAPQQLGEITSTFGSISFVPSVVTSIVELYDSLTPEERDMVDARVVEEFWLVEPFVDSVLSAFSHGNSDLPSAYKFFQTTADRRWSIGDAHFLQDNVPYRLQVQYSLNYSSVTYVTVERGFSEVDTIFAKLNERLESAEPYYPLSLGLSVTNPYGLNGSAITVNGFDRQLSTISVTLQVIDGTEAATMDLVVAGEPMEDRNGYLRQLRGERWEFVPAHVIALFGKETAQRFYVEADGKIGRIDQLSLVGAIELCPGLSIRFGDDVPRAVQNWSESAPAGAYTECELAFNYSPNGNVLYSVASIANKRQVEVANGGATSASVWR